MGNVSVKYQLPNEDLDALISVTTDEDLENMFEEYDRVGHNHHNPRATRLRLFLFTKEEEDSSRPGSITSLLDGSANREHWFLDALNGTRPCLERGRSEASSIVSEVPDYLFGLDNSDESHLKPKTRNNNNVVFSEIADTGSPAPPYSSTSSLTSPIIPSLPNLPPVKTKPESPVRPISMTQQEPVGTPVLQSGYSGHPMWNYVQDTRYSAPTNMQQIPVYYVAGGAQPGNAPVQTIPGQTQYVQQQHYPGQIPIGYQQMGQAYGHGPGLARPIVTMDQQAYAPDRMYYGVRNQGYIPGYPGMVVPGGEELQRTGSDIKSGKISHLS
jgi:hypothetical protein